METNSEKQIPSHTENKKHYFIYRKPVQDVHVADRSEYGEEGHPPWCIY